MPGIYNTNMVNDPNRGGYGPTTNTPAAIPSGIGTAPNSTANPTRGYGIPSMQKPASTTLDMSQERNPYSMSGSNSVTGPNYSYSQSGLSGDMGDRLSGFLDQAEGFIPMYQQGMQRMLGLPGEIDSWTRDLMNNYRASGRDAIDVYGQVGNQMAQRGVVGGSVPDSIRAMMMDQMAGRIQEQQANALSNAIGQKVNAIMGVPQLALGGIGQTAGLLGLGQQSESASYGTGSQSRSASYQEDPTAWTKIIMQQLQQGY